MDDFPKIYPYPETSTGIMLVIQPEANVLNVSYIIYI